MGKEKNPDADGLDLSRRDFLQDGAVGLGAVALGAAATASAAGNDELTWDYEADIVVIGSGAAGLPAAIRARDLGASVIVVVHV